MSQIKKLRITLSGKTHDVVVEILDDDISPGPAASAAAPVSAAPLSPLAAPPSSAAAPRAGGPGSVPCPLTGKIVQIAVQRGQKVVEGDQLLTIEAMKMNTYLYAPRAGTVTELLVHPGEAVVEGQELLRLE